MSATYAIGWLASITASALSGDGTLEAAGVVASLVQSVTRTDRPDLRMQEGNERAVELAGAVVVAWPRQ